MELEEAMTSFFLHLRTVMPLTSIILGRYAVDGSHVFVLSQTTTAGTTREFRECPLTDSQRILGKAHHFFEPSQAQDMVVESARHPLAKMYDFKPYGITYPMYVHRLAAHNNLYGGANFVFEEGTNITDWMIAILREIEAPLSIFMSAWFQYWKLQQLNDQIYRENRVLHRKLAGLDKLEDVHIIGLSGGLKDVGDKLKQVGPLDVTVLLRGETGTGKEMAARSLHLLSPRRKGAFVAVNCGAIPPTLIDSELFGHVKGAFTGATSNRKGRFEQAHGGTLFLDEIAELPVDFQVRLLRVLEEREVERVGGGAPVPVNFRLVAATHRNIERMVEQGTFREDLYYRLSIVTMNLPPLRERKQDIPLLLRHFLEQAANRFGVLMPDVPPEQERRLFKHDWPGNIRELRNVAEEAVALSTSGELAFNLRRSIPLTVSEHVASLAPHVHKPRSVQHQEHDDEYPYEQMQKSYFERALRRCHGKIRGKGGAAELLNMNYSTLRAKLRKYGVLNSYDSKNKEN